MSEEIKDVLEHLFATQNIKNGWTSFSDDECKYLYDYITNLQQENQQLKERLKHHNEIVEYEYDLMVQKDKYKSALDEIRELVSHFSGGQLCECSKELGIEIEKILDKAGKQ